MSKCDCCGKRGLMAATLDSGIYMYYVCLDCNDKINKVIDGVLQPEDVIGEKTDKGLEIYIRENYNCNSKSEENKNDGSIFESENRIEDNPPVSSTAGDIIKFISVIVIVASILGAIFIGKDSVVIGIVAGFGGFLGGMLSYGIGEICCRLKSIDVKMDRRR